MTDQILLIASAILLIIAAIIAWRPAPMDGYGHAAGWAGLACYVLAAVLP